MTEKSLLRTAGLAGILLALTSWVAVVVFLTLPAAQQEQPIVNFSAYLASVAENPTGIYLFNGLYALTAFWALVGVIGAHYHLRQSGEAWSASAALIGAINAAGWLATGLYQLANLRYAVSLYAPDAIEAAQGALAAPSPINPFNLMTAGLTAVWFLVVGLLILRADLPHLLGYLGLIAAVDLAVNFVAALAGLHSLTMITALIAGAVGGPIFWLWLGVILWRE